MYYLLNNYSFIIVSASRSPPGQVWATLQSCCGWGRVFWSPLQPVLKNGCLAVFRKIQYNFRCTFVTWGVHLKSLWPPGGHFWSILVGFWNNLMVKKRAGAPKVPQERPKAPSPVSPSRFGDHFGSHFQ